MTTAHRPTWKAAVGKASEGGWTAGGAVSSRIATLDVASHTKLKTRQGSQVVDKKAALRESLLKLEEAESKAPPRIGKRQLNPAIEAEGRRKLLTQTAEVDEAAIKAKYDDEDEDKGDGGDDDGFFSDLDDKSDNSDLDNDSDDSDDDEDSDDEEAALQAELAKIRAEREAAKQKQQQEEAKQEEAMLEEAALIGNPLLHETSSGGGVGTGGKLKRRWNDDVVFRNQAKGEPAPKKRFINDTVRNDFHKRFLTKFFR